MKIDNQTKLQYYDILNSVKMEHLKSNIPFNIVNSNDIKLTYKEVQLKYINGKNYFITVPKLNKGFNNKSHKNTTAKKISVDMKKEWTEKDRDDYKKNKEQQNKFTPEETAAYLERKKRRERSKSPQREYTPEETAAYLERKKRREKKGGVDNKVLVFY